MKFSHVEGDRSRMVDISDKINVQRAAVAEGSIRLRTETIKAIKEDKVAKGNVLSVANTAAIMAVKKTPEIIPMCHPIPLTSVDVSFELREEGKEQGFKVKCTVRSVGKTGVEMEAITGASVALLTIWDMVKSMEKDETGNYPDTVISDIKVIKKEKKEI